MQQKLIKLFLSIRRSHVIYSIAEIEYTWIFFINKIIFLIIFVNDFYLFLHKKFRHDHFDNFLISLIMIMK
jgi:hypothetical protein